jgi:hypothetical protein
MQLLAAEAPVQQVEEPEALPVTALAASISPLRVPAVQQLQVEPMEDGMLEAAQLQYAQMQRVLRQGSGRSLEQDACRTPHRLQ